VPPCASWSRPIARIPGLIVRGHRDWPGVAKACPSFDVAAWLDGQG
jgi:hypothetical protein